MKGGISHLGKGVLIDLFVRYIPLKDIIKDNMSLKQKNPIYSTSLDRIDSKMGYIKGNVRWVSRAINWMKNDMGDNYVHELIDILIKNKREPF
jgi:hypothetical protein